MRLYLPSTMPLLAAAWAAGAVPVTDDAVVAEGEGEEEEYAALLTAADLSASLLGGPGRRVVVVAETASLTGPVPLSRVVAVHLDTTDTPDPEDDLAWYATQEIPHLLC